MYTNCIPLSQLSAFEKAKIKGYDSSDFPIKLIELGLTQGVELEILNKAPFRGPILVEFGDSQARVALRIDEAKCILIEKI